MKKLFLCCIVLQIILLKVNAQQQKTSTAKNQADVGFGFGTSQGSFSGSYIHNWHLGKKGKFFIGTGARFTTYFGNEIKYLSAPASLAVDEKSIDTLMLSKPSVSALNLLINLGYNFSPKLQVGFNIDAVGFSFGKNSNAKFTGNGTTANVNAKPTGFNILLGGNNDQGTLNSQFYLQYLIGKQWGVKVAYQYLFTEFTTDTKVQTLPEANDRFRNKAAMGYVAFSYSF